MSLYQLFSKKPSEEIVSKVLSICGLENFQDTKFFCKKTLDDIGAVEKINNILEEIEIFYLPCKKQKYLRELNSKKVITILRQVIRPYNFFLYSKERYIKGEKYITYQIMPNDKKLFLKTKKKDETYIVSFD